jgi:hypothetical protein
MGDTGADLEVAKRGFKYIFEDFELHPSPLNKTVYLNY